MICNKCGKNIADEAKFCTWCGNNLDNVNNTQTPSYPNPQVPNVNNVIPNNQAVTSQQVINNNPVVTSQPVINNNPVVTSQPVMNNNPVNYNYNYSYNNGTVAVNDNNKNTLYICISIVLVAVIVILLIFIKNKDTEVFIDDSGNGNQEIYTSNPASNNNGKTVIKTDNIYVMTIKSREDIINKIKEDSESQKSQCPAKIKQIEDRISKNYNITAVNLCEIDTSVAVELEKVIKFIYEEYPNARGYLTNMTIINAPVGQGYIAAYQPFLQFILPEEGEYPIGSKMSIMLNSTYYLNIKYLESSMKQSSSSGHFPPNTTISSPMAHELGHYLSFIAMMREYNVDSVMEFNSGNIQNIYKLSMMFGDGEFSKKMLDEAFNNYKKTHNEFKTLDDFRGSISGYALAKDDKGQYIYDESIAEAFHDTYLNGNNAKDASKEIIKVLKERLS